MTQCISVTIFNWTFLESLQPSKLTETFKPNQLILQLCCNFVFLSWFQLKIVIKGQGVVSMPGATKTRFLVELVKVCNHRENIFSSPLLFIIDLSVCLRYWMMRVRMFKISCLCSVEIIRHQYRI